MKALLICLVAISIVVLLVFALPKANAANSPVIATPGSQNGSQSSPYSARFEYGARLDPGGLYVAQSVNAAAAMGLDWIAIDFDWGTLMPDAGVLPDLDKLTQAMLLARQANLPVMITLKNAPAWAQTNQGPSPDITASLIISLARLYPGTFRAVELYPGANTIQGWGKAPNPIAYTQLLKAVYETLQKASLDIIPVLSISPAINTSDIDDRLYLEMLYQQAAVAPVAVVGLRLPGLTGKPLEIPDEQSGATQTTAPVLRHYEQIRQVMLRHKQSGQQIWITGFSWPVGSAAGFDPALATLEGQAHWVNQAYQLLRAQLYIGAAFIDRLNPPSPGGEEISSINDDPNSLLMYDASLHPACQRLSQLTALDGNTQTVHFESAISKKTPSRANLKPSPSP